jgi:16S rRNA (uracil1498-N3)-methyltransferase
MPANDRMDWLVEKATEFRRAAHYPFDVAGTRVLRLQGERADKKDRPLASRGYQRL